MGDNVWGDDDSALGSFGQMDPHGLYHGVYRWQLTLAGRECGHSSVQTEE